MCSWLSGIFGCVKFVGNLLILKFHCWSMLKCLLWSFSLKWWSCCELMMNTWFICYECVGYMLVMITHELGDDKCVVVVMLLCFYDFCKMGHEWRSLIMMNWSELMMLLLWVRMNRIFVLNYEFWMWDCLGENWVFQ